MNIRDDVIRIAEDAKKASRLIASLSTAVKNRALLAMADGIEKNLKIIQQKNQLDVLKAKKENLPDALIDRLLLNEKRIKDMAQGLRSVAGLPDPVGEIVEENKRPNGLMVRRIRAPLGVVGIIYESRPNVTCDAASLCLKAGNSVILRGGSEAIETNRTLATIMCDRFPFLNIPEKAVQMIESTERDEVKTMVKLDSLIDIIILRGGDEMIGGVTKEATVPLVKHGKGVCHTYVDANADKDKALAICFNAKVQRPGVCNAMETLLVHKDIAASFLPDMINKYHQANVEIRGDEKTMKIIQGIRPATDEDWSTEYLALILAIKVVDSLEEAIDHITEYGSKHSDAIVTEKRETAERFLKEVDSAAVYWNASTRFTDGGEFGMGMEMGISTQKLHVRGPMGLKELTSTRFVIYGNGQTRE